VENFDDALRSAQQGDPDAYGAVVAATQARLRSFIAGYVPRASWVDDLAQQAFISAYRSLDSFRVGTDFYAWL
jgi:RNA polymerase sigma-70 factor (ECF subfamily)